MTSIDRTAYPTFKRMSSRDLTDAFTPSDDEIEWARDKTSTDPHLLALAVWLKSYRRLGYFPKLEDVPDAVVDHVRSALKLPGGVVAEVDAARTAKRQRDLIRKRLGVRYNSAQARGFAEAAIEQAALTKDNPADLINVALDVLVKKGCELPGYTTLDLSTKTIRARVNKGFFITAAGRIDPVWRPGPHQLMVVDPATRRSGFDKLKDPPKAATLTKFKQRLEHMQRLDGFGPTEQWLERIPPGKIGHFAGEARTTTVEDFVRVTETKRLTLLASLIHVLRAAARDEVTDMFCKRLAIIHRKGKDRLEELREEHRAESGRLLEVFGDVLAAAKDAAAPTEQPPMDPDQASAGPDAEGEHAEDGEDPADGDSDGDDATVDGGLADHDKDGASVDASGADELAARTGRLVLKALEAAGGLDRLAAAHQAVAAYHGNNYLPLLEQYYRSHRAALFTLVDSVAFEATSEDRSVLDALEFVRAVRARRGDWIEESVILGRGKEKVEVSIDITTLATDLWRNAVLPFHPVWRVGGGVPARLAAGQRFGHPARPGARRHPGPIAAGLRFGGPARLRSPSRDQELARPELLPADGHYDVQAHRLAVRRPCDRLGPHREALA